MNVVRDSPATGRRAAAHLSLAALASAVLATVMLDVIAPGLGPLVRPLSAFALTEEAGLWMFVVESAALGIGLLAVTAYQRGAAVPFVVTIGVAGIGLAVSGIVVTDPWFPWERAPTPSGQLHIGAVLITLGALGAAMVHRRRAVPVQWRAVRDYWSEGGFGARAGSAMLYLVTLRVREQPLLWFGFWERLLLAIDVAWCASLAVGRRAPSAWRVSV